MRKNIILIFLAIVLALIVCSASVLLTKNRTEFIAEYGGYGLKGDWRTLGKVRVCLIFENGKGYGNVILGENTYRIEFLKNHTIVRGIEFSTVYEGHLAENEGRVRFAIYKDVIVGEVDVNGTTYSFGAAQTLESAVLLLDMYNEHLEEEALRRGMVTLPPLMDVYIPPGNIPAIIDFEPDTLDLKSNVEWITAYIELLADYNVCDINVSTIRLNGIIPVEINNFEDINSRLGDHDGDGFLDLFVRFNIADVKEALGEIGREKIVKLEVTGFLINGKPFYGVNWIKVIK